MSLGRATTDGVIGYAAGDYAGVRRDIDSGTRQYVFTAMLEGRLRATALSVDVSHTHDTKLQEIAGAGRAGASPPASATLHASGTEI